MRLGCWRQASALEIQREHQFVAEHLPSREPNEQFEQVVDRGLAARRGGSQDFAKVDTEIDCRSAQAFSALPGPVQHELSDPKISQLGPRLPRHQTGSGVFIYQRKVSRARVTIRRRSTPPPTPPPHHPVLPWSSSPAEAGRISPSTAPQAQRSAQRTVLCKDPFRSSDERVKRLIASRTGLNFNASRRAVAAARSCAVHRPAWCPPNLVSSG